MKESARIRQHSQPKEVVSSWTGELYIFSHWRPEKWTHIYSWVRHIVVVKDKIHFERNRAYQCPAPRIVQCIDLHNWMPLATEGSVKRTNSNDSFHRFHTFHQRDLNALTTLDICRLKSYLKIQRSLTKPATTLREEKRE